MTDVKTTVNETLSGVAENTDADHAIKDNAHAGHSSTLPPHLQGLGINVDAAAKARAANEQTDRNLSSIPPFRKP
jgi:hypothetical protein